MRLSELKTGERGVIVKVAGHGGFRKRIVEMGFIKGQTAEVLLNAPLQDPVKYKIMGYEVSLRHSEADMIEVVTEAEAAMSRETPEDQTGIVDHDAYSLQLDREVERRRHVINVALVGNPNCGKTSLFNFASGAHERVGNYSGVTVDAKEGKARYLVTSSTWWICLALIPFRLTHQRNCMCASKSWRRPQTWLST